MWRYAWGGNSSPCSGGQHAHLKVTFAGRFPLFFTTFDNSSDLMFRAMGRPIHAHNILNLGIKKTYRNKGKCTKLQASQILLP